MLANIGKLVKGICSVEYSNVIPTVYTPVTITISGAQGTQVTYSTDIESSFVYITGYGVITIDSSGSGSFQVYYTKAQEIISTITCNANDILNDLITPSDISVSVSNVNKGSTVTSYAVSGFFKTSTGSLVIVVDELQVTLQLVLNRNDVSSQSLVGTISTMTLNGLYSFPNINVDDVGIYQFKVSFYTYSGLTDSFEIVAHEITSITYTPNQLTFNAYTSYNFEVKIYDKIGDPYINSCIIGLIISDSTIIGGYSQGSTSSGVYIFSNIYFQTSGNVELSIKAVNTLDLSDAKAFSFDLTINKANLSFQSYSFATIGTEITLIVDIKNYNGGLVTTSASFECMLTLLESGVSSSNLVNGGITFSSNSQCIYSNVRIMRSGTYALQIIVPQEALQLGITNQFTVTSSIVSVTISPYTEYIYSTYFIYYFIVKTFGENNFEFLEYAYIELSVDGSLQLGGTLAGSASAGSYLFMDIFYKASGSRTITASAKNESSSTVSVSGTLTKTISDLQIYINPFYQLTNTLIKSDITIKFTNNDGTLRTTNNEFNCKMELKKSDSSTLTSTILEVDTIQGNTVSKTSTNGECTFKNVRIMTSGTYVLYFSSEISGISKATTNSFTTTNPIIMVSILSLSPSLTYNSYSLYDFEVILYGENYYFYLETASISLTIDDGSVLGGAYDVSTNAGYGIICGIYFQTSGIRTLSATVTYGESLIIGTLNLNTEGFYFAIQEFTPLNNIGVKTNIIVNIVDSQNVIQTLNEEVSCTLDLKNFDGSSFENDNLEIDNSIVTCSDGVCSFFNVRIKRSGIYMLTVSSITSAIISDSTLFSITSSIVSVSISSENSLDLYTAYFVYDFKVDFYGENGFDYLENVDVELSINEDALLGGVLIGSTNTGTIIFTSVYFKSSGFFTVTAEAEDSAGHITQESLSVTVENSLIEILPFNALLNIGIKSDISLKVTDSNGNLKTSSEEFECNIELKNPDETILNEISLEVGSIQDNIAYSNSIGGVCTFLSLRIMRFGTYIFYFSSSSTAVSPSKTALFTTISSITSVIVSPVNSQNIYTAYFTYDFKVEIYGEGNFFFLETATISLSVDDNTLLEGPTTFTTNTGSHIFNGIYFQTSGNRILSASVAYESSLSTGILDLSINKISIVIQDFATLGNIGVQSTVNAEFVDSNYVLRTSSKEFSCDIDLNTSDGLELKNDNLEVVSKTVESYGGICTFSSVRVKRSGSYIITISSETEAISPVATGMFTTSSSIILVNIFSTSSENLLTAYFIYSFKIEIFGEGNFNYLEPCNVELNLNDINKIYGYSPKISVTEGFTTFSELYFDKSGDFSLIASAEILDSTPVNSMPLPITILDININIDSTINLKTIADMQDLSISFTDFYGNIQTSSKEFSCIIELYDSSNTHLENTIEGTIATLSLNGICIFENVRVLKSGIGYYLNFSSSDISVKDGLSLKFDIKSSLLDMTVVFAEGPYVVYFTYRLVVNLYGDGNFPYLEGVTIKLTLDDNTEIGGYSEATTDAGNYQYDIYFTSIGSRKLTILATQNSFPNTVEKTIDIILEESTIDVTFTSIQTIGDFTSVTAIITDQNANTEAINGDYKCALKLQYFETGFDTDSISGELSVDDVNGVCIFNDIRITRSGSYRFYVSIAMINVELVGISKEVVVTSSVQVVSATVTNANPSIYFDFEVSVTIKSEGNFSYLETCIITITADDNSKIGNNQYTTSTGFATIDIFVTSTSLLFIKAIVSNTDSNIVLLFPTPLKFTLDATPNPNSSADIFELKVSVKSIDDVVEAKNYNSGEYPFIILLTPNSQIYSGQTLMYGDSMLLDGSVSSQTSVGTITLSEMKIISAGTFTMTVSSIFNPIITEAALSFTITNNIKDVSLSSLEPNPTAQVAFLVKVDAIGDDDNPYVSSAIFKILNNEVNIGECTLDTNGACSDQIVFTEKGDYTIIVRSENTDLVDILDINVSNMIIKINENLPDTLTSDTILSISVTVYDCTGTSVVTTEADDCDIAISLINEASNSDNAIVGTLGRGITNGNAIFDDIQILSSGSFNMLFTSNCPYIDSIITSKSISVINSIKSITVETISTMTIFFPFDVNITIFGDDDNYYLGDCNLALTIDDNSFIGNANSITNTGKATYRIYFESTGIKTLKASCSQSSSIISTDSILILNEILKVTLNQIPESGLDTFSVTVEVLDNTGTLKQTDGNDTNIYDITLRLYCNDDNGEYRDEFFNIEKSILTTNDGIVTFEGLNIWKSGNYIIEAMANSLYINSGASDGFYVVVTIKEMNVDYPEKLYSFFDFSLNVKIFAQTYVYFTESTKVIIEAFPNVLIGELAITDNNELSTGNIEFTNLHFIDYGDVILKISGFINEVSESKTITIKVIPSIIILALNSDNSRRLIESTETFSLTATVYNYEDGKLSSYNHPISLSIEATSTFYSGEVLEGIASQETVSSSCTFSPIRILSMGTFKFKASSPGLTTNYTTEEFTIENSIKKFALSYSDDIENVVRNELFNVSILIIGEDDNPYIGQVDVEFDQSPYSSFDELKPVINYDGDFSIEVLPLRSGKLILYALVTDFFNHSFNDLIEITSQSAAIEIVFDPIPVDSNSKFNAYIFAYNSYGELLSTTLETNFKFSCQDKSICSGLVIDGISLKSEDKLNIANGLFLYENCRILSSGDFEISVSADGYVKSQAFFTSFKNYVKEIQISQLESSPSVHFIVPLSIKLIGDDNLNYILPTNISLIDANNNPFTGDIKLETSSGYTIHNISFSHAKTYNITASTTSNSFTSSLSITVLKNKINIILPGEPYYDNKDFIVSVEVYDNSGKTLETSYGVYSFIMFTNPNFNLLSNTIKTSAAKGSLTIHIDTAGIYTLNIKDNDFIDATSLSINVKEGIKSIITTAKFDQNISTLFELPLKILNKTNAAFLHETTLNIICEATDLYGEALTIKTSNGTGSFWIYFNIADTKKCKIQSSFTVLESFTFTINNTKANNDILCDIGINDKRCYKCKDAAKKDSDESCTCGGNSYYDKTSKLCVCEDGFDAINGFCVKCGWYFKENEIKGYYDEDYKGIIMEFTKPVAQSKEGSCNSIVTIPDSLKENFLSCSWLNSLKLKVAFSKIVSGDEFYMELDPSLVQYVKSGACSENIYELNIMIVAKYDKPTPIASITAPSSLSVGCDSDMDIIIMTKNINPDYKYTWSSSYTPANKALIDLINNQTSSSFSVNIKSFIAGDLTIHLKIESQTFETSDSIQKIINVSGKKEIMAQMSAGNSIKIKKSDSLPIKPTIINTCGSTGPYNYTWSYFQNITSETFNFETFMQKQKKSDSILISPNDLNVGILYTFTVIIKAENIEGSASINVEVESNPIEIQFLRSSGSVGNKNDLSIAIQAIDPDDTEAKLNIAWSCFEGKTECFDNNNSDILKGLDTNSYELIVPKDRLRNFAMYSFYASVTANYKSTTGQIDIEIDTGIKGNIKIKPFQGPVNNDIAITVTPEIEPYEGVIFKWIFSPPLESSNIILNQSYMYILPKSLKYSVNYQCMTQIQMILQHQGLL